VLFYFTNAKVMPSMDVVCNFKRYVRGVSVTRQKMNRQIEISVAR